MKTETQIQEINQKRAEAMKKLREAKQAFADTECSRGADIILAAIRELKEMETWE